MSFLANLLRNRERSRLEEAVRQAPTADAFLRLARAHQEEGDPALARQVAKRGLAAFTADAALAQLEQDLAVLEREAECKRLREQIANFPNPRLYARLAELYRAGREPDKAFQVARSGLAGFPDHGGLHYVLGLLQADAGVKEEACRQLARAAELDKFNYAALKLLGRLLTELGRPAEAAQAYARIRSFAPDDEEIKSLHGRVAQAGGVSPAPAASRPESAGPAAGEAPAARAATTVPAVPAAPEAPAAGARAPAGAPASLLAIALARMVGKDGIEGAILVDAAGLAVAATLPAGRSEEAVAAAAAALRRAGGPACGELGLGGFEEAFVESADGALHLYAVRDMTLAVLAAPRSRAGLVALHARGFAKKALGAESAGAGP